MRDSTLALGHQREPGEGAFWDAVLGPPPTNVPDRGQLVGDALHERALGGGGSLGSNVPPVFEHNRYVWDRGTRIV